MRLQTALPLLFWSFIGFLACSEEPFEPVPDGRDYFPLEIGRVLEYKYDSIIFDDFQGGNRQDTFSGFIREEIVDTVATSGALEYVIRRSIRSASDQPWVNVATASEHADEAFAYRQESNLRLIQMRFPLRSTSTWDPTALIDPSTEIMVGTEFIEMFSNWSGEVTTFAQQESIGDFTFDEVTTSMQADDDNEIERRYVMQKFARGVGLVERVDTILDSRCKRLGDLVPCFDETWSEKGEKGYILRQEIYRIR